MTCVVDITSDNVQFNMAILGLQIKCLQPKLPKPIPCYQMEPKKLILTD